MERSMKTSFILLVSLILTGGGCDQRTNPLNPDAVVTVREVKEINTVITMEEQQYTDPQGNTITICQVTFDPGRVEVVFQEEYGGQWATVYEYQVEYYDENFNPLPYTPLHGYTSVRIPPLGQASVNVALLDNEIFQDLIFSGRTAVKAHLTLKVKGDYQGETTEGAGLVYTFDFYHDVVVQFRLC